MSGARPPDLRAVQELFATRRLVVLDFDGPVTRLLPDPRHIDLAEAVKTLLRDHRAVLAPAITASIDHVQVLRYVAEKFPALLTEVEALCSATEVQAAETATPAPGAVDLLDRLRAQRRPVAIVTNNDPRVVTRFARHHDIDLAGITIHGRESGHAERLKPSPWLLEAALRAHSCEPGEALLIGDSPTDVTAALAAGMPCVGMASEPQRADVLIAAGAFGVIADLRAFR